MHIIFLASALGHALWGLVVTASLRLFLWLSRIRVLAEIGKSWVGLDSKMMFFSEKMRKDAKRGEKRLLGTGKVHMI